MSTAPLWRARSCERSRVARDLKVGCCHALIHVCVVSCSLRAFDATNEVLAGEACAPVTLDQYKVGCRYTTPERFNFHMGAPTGDAAGVRLGAIFDETYVARVSDETAGLFDGIDPLLRALAMQGHPQGALSNACGAYVRAVMTANSLDEQPGAPPTSAPQTVRAVV